MKKYFFALFLLFFLFSHKVEAFNVVSTTPSIPTGSQYSPGNTYGFNIILDEIESESVNIYFEWKGLSNQTNPCSSLRCDIWEFESDLAAGSYSYRWIIENSTDSLSIPDTYVIEKNSSSITLTLDGTEGNKSYEQYTVANFVARLAVPEKTIRLESNYSGWSTQVNMSIIQNSTNLTQQGIFSLTASWDGDANYTSSSKTFYFDSGPPQISNPLVTPQSPVGYVLGNSYKFQITVIDITLKSVWFESNFTGTMKTYNAASNISVQNSSGTFWITLNDLGATSFAYKWHATDSLDDESSTDFINYDVLKMNPLVMDIFPFLNYRSGDQITAECRSITSEINVSNFGFYKNSEVIGNISSSTRRGIFLLSAGTYNFTCNTSGTGNYTNQSITRAINVSASPSQQENVTGELEIINVDFPSIEVGKTGEASFYLKNGLSKNIFNITVGLSGIPSDWFSVIKPSYIYTGETKEVRINFNIPSDAEIRTYNIVINANGNTSDGKNVNTAKSATMTITGIVENQPPTFFTEQSNTTNDEMMFSLEWYDDNGLSGYIFSSNITGEWENDSWTPMTGKNGLIDVRKPLSSSISSVAWKIYANDTSNDWSASDEYVASMEQAPTGSSIIFVIAFIIIVIIVVIAIVSMKRTNKEEKIEYVYRREDSYDKKY